MTYLSANFVSESSPLFIIYKEKKLDLKKFRRLNTAFEIAKRISFQKQKSYTGFIVKLSTIATAISVAAIIITFSIVNGFQSSIANKVYSFWGNINISTVNGSVIDNHPHIQQLLKHNKEVKNITPYAIQTAVISYQQEMEGITVKGIPTTVPQPFLISGRNLQAKDKTTSMEIVVSKELSNKLKLGLGAWIRLYFMNQGAVQQRKLKVVGIYHSGMEDYDQQFAMVDLQLLQQLVNSNAIVSGYSVDVKEGYNANTTSIQLQQQLPPNYIATTIEEQYPQIFDWIQVQSINRNVTMTIMMLIAIVNLLTCLFILMLERVKMIGTLTAIGGNYNLIRKIFLYQASFISWTGILIGCVVGVGLSLLQQYTGWIQLDETAYFMKVLPIRIIPVQILWIILSTAVISYLSFLAPTIWIKKISPAQTIRFD